MGSAVGRRHAGGGQRAAAPLRVVAWPAYKNRRDQPYNWLLSKHVELCGGAVRELGWRALLRRPDILHVHWPERFCSRRLGEAFLKTEALLAILQLMRSRGCRLVWTAHNLRAHDGRHARHEARFWRRFTAMVDGTIALSQGGLDAVFDSHPALAGRPSAVIPLGEYRAAYGAAPSRAEARRRLSLPAGDFVVLSVGMVKRYKNVPALVSAFRSLERDARLVVRGPCADASLRSEIQEVAAGDPRIDIDLRFVPEPQLPDLLACANLVVAPYAEILNSATALLALSYDVPVVVPRTGAMAELRDAAGSEWVYLYDPPFRAATLEAAIEWAAAERRGAPGLRDFSWPRIGRQTVEFYESVKRARRGGNA